MSERELMRIYFEDPGALGEIREVLRPFAEEAQCYDGIGIDMVYEEDAQGLAHLRRARDLYLKLGGKLGERVG